MTQTAQKPLPPGRSGAKPWYRQLYVQVLVAIAIGVLLGWRWPGLGEAMQPIGTTFIAAMKMLIGPIVFLTIIGGIAGVADLKKVGLTGLKALTYFQVGTIVALVIGLVAINLVRLGEDVNADPAKIQASGSAQQYIESGETQHWWEFFTHLVPESFFGAFAEGDILQIIFLAVLFGIAIKAVGPIGEPIAAGVRRLTEVVFKVLSFVMKAAPLGAFGAMAYAVGAFGLSTLTSLGSLIALFYATSILFVVVVLGGFLALYVRLNIFQLFRYLKDEFFLVLGTSTAEPALPGLMRKMTFMGADRTTVGLVVPTGYSFNLDGAAIYLSLAAVYIAQATNTPLSVGQQLGLLAVMLLTSKGAAGVAGGGFIALTATLSTIGTVPAAGIMLIFGIDKFMSECRALVNFYGNAVATLAIAKWDGALDITRARQVLADRTSAERATAPEPQPSGVPRQASAETLAPTDASR
ncbi:aerobic C4-dicarboxylate transport protein [Saccharopolyspora kobensis]|uniref:Aerobic C4-dicarboxylate transport protein n=1 Tax=Saccharopolyspora kobensis TaxID=146035 RepID=A0A1H5T5B1_9PSEU|nr:C4-dicarboxylate transporter DctA [Saccharopolyspora kobensis]SEF57187.1 aerobic C4-dicarboxylate transport protein [Saccharopolyspora kobensis]SFC50917.1 aerobic C4-dicarboxylate transport protein [Saccharopolyspora kobensis]